MTLTETNLKSQVKHILERHEGRQSAITRRELRRILGLDMRQDRKLRLLIVELREDGFPVLFATTKPAGYYMPTSFAELKVGLDKMRSYVIDECISIRAVKMLGLRYLQGQEQIKLM